MLIITKKNKSVPYFGGVFSTTMDMTKMPHMASMPDDIKKKILSDHWSSHVAVRCVKKAVEYVKNNGGKVLLESMPIPVGTLAHFVDPNGEFFAVIEYNCGQSVCEMPKSGDCKTSTANCDASKGGDMPKGDMPKGGDMSKGGDCDMMKGECHTKSDNHCHQSSCHEFDDCCEEGYPDMNELMGWFEYVADDEKSLEKAKLFYSGLFGWTICDGVADGAKTAMAKHVGDQYPSAYLYAKDAAHSAKGWTPSVFVPCVKGYADKAKSLGMEVIYLDANACARAVIKDKTGAVFGLRSYK
jgi:predicted enzyme related to lactoylglutathione lyase